MRTPVTMIANTLVIGGLFTALYAAGCGGDDGAASAGPGAPATVNACPRLCEVSGSIECTPDTNQACASCEPVRGGVPWCAGRADDYWNCFADDVNNFYCSEGNTGILWEKEDACFEATQAFGLCVCLGDGAAPMPDPKSVCSAYCAKAAALPCAPPSCEADCLKATDPATLGGPRNLADRACLAEDETATFTCEEDSFFAASSKCTAGLLNFCGSLRADACNDACAAQCGDNLCMDLPMTDACRACVLAMPPDM